MRLAKELALFNACVRIGSEAECPIVIENVRGAQKWVGRARWMYGSFALWGDVPALMPMIGERKMSGRNMSGDPDKRWGSHNVSPSSVEFSELMGTKNNGGSWFAIGSPGQKETNRNPVHNGVKQHKSGRAWFADPDSISGSTSSKSSARKQASAMIAKIPFELAQYIARVFKPQEADEEGLEKSRCNSFSLVVSSIWYWL